MIAAKPVEVADPLVLPERFTAQAYEAIPAPPAPAPIPAAPTPIPAAPAPVAAAPIPAAPVAAAPAADPFAAATMPTMPAGSILCPHCESPVSATAKKCRHCGEFIVDPKLAKKNKAAAARKEASEQSAGPVDYAISFLLPPVGLGLGIVAFTRGAATKAFVMLGISGVMTVVLMGGVIFQAFRYPKPKWDRPLADNANPVVEYDLGGSGGEDESAAEEPETDSPPSGGMASSGGQEPSIIQPPSEEDLARQPEAIQRGMRANVRLVVTSPAGSSVGSGVIIERRADMVFIITNRHVVDPLFARSRGQSGLQISQLTNPEIMFVTGDEEPGKILWFAPDNVDLAVVRAFCPNEGIEVADCAEDPAVTIGESVFAVGNPHGIGWSLTKGTVSGLRTQDTATGKVPVVQTDAQINPGNSGGGLYNAEGQLVGINDFIIDPSIARGMGFAIRYPFFRELYEKNPPQ
ncbi:MAG: trypsin-like peptidase domain-containing protein [Planctomycetota bacterium]